MRSLLPLALCGFAALSACAVQRQAPPSSSSQTTPAHISQAASILENSAQALRELRQSTNDKMLDAAIDGARAIIVLPNLYQAGFVYSVHGGNGVLVARRADGGWGAPVFVTVGGAGYGFQAGLEKSRLVLTIMEDEMLERLLDSGLNFDASAKYDILGVREETSRGSLTEERPVMAFADGVGLMAGVALRGGVLTTNRSLTQSYHGAASGSVEEIMKGISAPSLETFSLWAALGVVPEASAQNRDGSIGPGRSSKP